MSAIFRVSILTSCFVVFLVLQYHEASPNPLDTTETPKKDRISVQKCNEYKELKREEIYLAGLSLRLETIRTNDTICKNTGGLIINGKNADLGDYPHMAIIGYRKENQTDEIDFRCGGSLISENFVLTAAHCKIKGEGRTSRCVVRLGTVKLFDPNAKDFSVKSFFRHPKYNIESHLNDIALIKLNGSVSFGNPKVIAPACLWQSHEIGNSEAIATGWGKTIYYSNVMSENLKVLELVILDADSSCGNFNLSESQICAKGLNGNFDTCHGDGGGPLQIPDSNVTCISYIVGLTSIGEVMCGFSGLPSVYTRVSSYLDWIEDKVWGHKKQKEHAQ